MMLLCLPVFRCSHTDVSHMSNKLLTDDYTAFFFLPLTAAHKHTRRFFFPMFTISHRVPFPERFQLSPIWTHHETSNTHIHLACHVDICSMCACVCVLRMKGCSDDLLLHVSNLSRCQSAHFALTHGTREANMSG